MKISDMSQEIALLPLGIIFWIIVSSLPFIIFGIIATKLNWLDFPYVPLYPTNVEEIESAPCDDLRFCR